MQQDKYIKRLKNKLRRRNNRIKKMLAMSKELQGELPNYNPGQIMDQSTEVYCYECHTKQEVDDVCLINGACSDDCD